jgi:gliding motility-associated-like protein
MSKINVLFLFFFINMGIMNAQNLVINPSFENTVNGCAGFPFPIEGFADLNDWDNANSNTPGDSCSSPDLFSTCNTGITNILGVPGNALGYQNARTGDKYAGIISYSAPFGFNDQYREYIQGRTNSALVAGQTYCVSMYVSLADDSPWACNNMGIYFSNSQYLRDACAGTSPRINVTPQLNYSCAVINDTTPQWYRIQWDYVAAGGEQYFVIGNFFNDAGTNSVSTGATSLQNQYAYYYIDDVSIVPNTCCFADISPVGTVCVSDSPIILTAEAPNSAISCSPAAITGTWSGPGMATNGTFTPVTAGPGTHTITFTLSCGTAVTTEIIVSPCVALSVCVETNGNLTASNGVSPYSWQNQITTQDCSACFFGCAFPPGCAVNVTSWATFATSNSIPAPTVFPVQVIDNAGTIFLITSLASLPACSSNPCPTINVAISSQTDVGCGSTNNGSATVSASGGTAPYQYLWTPGNLTGPIQSSLSVGTYTVSVIDAASCTGSTTVTIGQASTLNLTMSSTPSTCGLDNGTASVAVSGGSGTYSYTWSPAGGTSSTTAAVAGGVTYTVNVTNGSCSGSNSILVGASNAITAASSTVGANCGATDGSATVTPSGGTLPYSYLWSPIGGNAATANGLGSGPYSVLISDATGCSLTFPINIPAIGGPTVTISSIVGSTCGQNDGSATATVTGGTAPYLYSWSPTGGNSAIANGISAGTYTVSVTDGAGCLVSETAIVPGGAPIVISNTVTDEDCGQNNGQIALTVSGGVAPFSFSWTPTNQNAAVISNLSGGQYSVIVTDADGCIVNGSYTVDIIGTLPVSVNPLSATINEGESVQLTASGGTTYLWTPSDGINCQSFACDTVIATPTITTTYEVLITGATGCQGTEYVTVFVNPICSKEVFVPTIFSPNGDGKNDQQCVLGNCIASMEFSIYNRWGEIVFSTTDQNQCWDGMYKSKKVNAGVFVYKLKASLTNGGEVNQSGNITVTQ